MFQASKAHGSRVLWRRTLLLPRTTANVPSFESTWVACPMASDSATATYNCQCSKLRKHMGRVSYGVGLCYCPVHQGTSATKKRNGRTANNKEVSHGMQGH